MSYNDIAWVSYDKLKNRSQVMQPYVNTTDTFPLGDRRYSHRHFRVRGDGVFELYLGNREVINAGLESRPSKRGGDKYAAEEYAGNSLIARVYPDNSFEFLSRRSGMSDLLFYNALIPNTRINCNNRFGGGVMTNGGASSHTHPLFHGLRVNLSDLSVHPTTDYVTYLPTLNRKEGKQFSAGFDEFHKTWRVLFEPMQRNAYSEIVRDLSEEYPAVFTEVIGFHKQSNHYTNPSIDGQELTNMILDLISKKRYADAALASLGYNHPWILYRIYKSHKETINYIYNFDPTLAKSVSKLTENCMKHTPRLFSHRAIESGAPLVATKWGLITMLKSTGETVVRL